MRLAIYHRVSTSDQDPELATEELKAYAARVGTLVALTVNETGSGARNDRPGLQRVMEAARRGEIDGVAVWKLDRFARSSLDLMTNISELTGLGVRFTCTSQGLEIKPDGDAISKLLLTVLSGVAEFERELIRERTRLGLDRARKKGKKLGRIPKALPRPDAVAELVKLGWGAGRISKKLGVSLHVARVALKAAQ
jgi:DNA invertase Pin-like site-specific DNA recombinase